MKTLKTWVISLAIVAVSGGLLFSLATPQTVSAVSDKCNSGFLGFPAWYKGLTKKDLGKSDSCDIASPSEAGGLSPFIWTIGLNVLDIVLMVIGYISVAFILYGGFILMVARGSSSGIAEGQATVRNAVIGFVVAFGSVPAVNYATSHLICAAGSSGFCENSASTIVSDALNAVYVVAGITAVITVIIAGYKYTISGGNSSEVEQSKNTILYAIIGLIVIIGAFTITNFVIGRF